MGTCIQDLQGKDVEAPPTDPAVTPEAEESPQETLAEEAPPPPLHEIYDALKRQLGLEGTFHEVINAACLQLGVPPTDGLHARGNACWRAMYGVTDYYPDAARPSLLTRLASWRGTGPEAVVVTGEVVGAETVPEPEGRQSEQQSRDWLSLENGELASLGDSSTRAPREGEVVEAASVGIITSGAVTEEGGHVEVEAPPGRLGLRFETDTGHRVIYMAPTSALAGRVSVGDRLVSIRAPGREFYCGSLRTGSDIVAEFRATAGTKRVLTFVRVVGNVVQGRGPRVDSS
jgi:hypothetical protein